MRWGSDQKVKLLPPCRISGTLILARRFNAGNR